MTKQEKLLSKIESILFETKIKKSSIANKLDITPTAFSSQLRNLKSGKSIPTRTLFVIEEMTGRKIFDI